MAAELLLGTPQITNRLLEKICFECNLCQPEIKKEENDGFRIYRYNYERYEDKETPLAEFQYLAPKGETRGLKIAFVDDFNPSRWA